MSGPPFKIVSTDQKGIMIVVHLWDVCESSFTCHRISLSVSPSLSSMATINCLIRSYSTLPSWHNALSLTCASTSPSTAQVALTTMFQSPCPPSTPVSKPHVSPKSQATAFRISKAWPRSPYSSSSSLMFGLLYFAVQTLSLTVCSTAKSKEQGERQAAL